MWLWVAAVMCLLEQSVSQCDLGSAVDRIVSPLKISNSYAVFGYRAFRKN